jgi:malto-oligosyltrehalose synthase
MTPRATVRLQFHRGFTFADAEKLVSYFARLGISHVYASPIATARPGSTHGYDVIDTTTVNPELGGEAGLRRLHSVLAGAGLGLILDIVPNHMAAAAGNAWWADVLRRGPASAYARFFDIDWEADEKVLLPVLGRPLEEALAAGDLGLDRDGRAVTYYDHRFPLAEGDSNGPLADLLARQHWRLAWWRTASDRINWRRFFDINELVSLRMEDEAAFEAVHALPLRLHAEGLVDGLRIDHIDGLTDPATYCRKLRRRLGDDALLVVEKILLRGERLPLDWACDGTTGYDFMNDVSAVQHDARGEEVLGAAWASLSGRPAEFAPEEELARREMIARSFSAQLDACAAAFAGGELVPTTLRRVLAEVLVHFPVYRTYGVAGRLSPEDKAILARAADGARRTCLATDRWAIEPVVGLFQRPDKARAVARFQQLSAPVAAKSVEDTAFYRYGRLVSRNDVGFDVERFALSAEAFHARVLARAKDHPHTLLATATHDHKRGEEVRARLAVLTEMAAEWAALQKRWTDALQPLCQQGTPAPGDIAMLLQTIVGAWPLDLNRSDREGRMTFAGRLAAWQEKALREAKLRTDWMAVDEHYERAARTLVTRLIADAALPQLLQEITALVQRIAPAGAINGLAQCVLRLSVPGIPDLYQGTEFWDLSLVDPDNRRPVDFAARVAALDGGDLQQKGHEWRDGRIKQILIARLLALRSRKPGLFAEGSYEPVRSEGPAADHVVALVRRFGRDWLLVAVPRLPFSLQHEVSDLQLGPTWHQTSLRHGALAGRLAVDVLTGEARELPAAPIPIGRFCQTLPFVLLENGD